ncbi:alkyl sulfatase dimerization domain-containing protein [Flavobacterium sp. LHD-85]|uniref:alkyl/aryl-sulfatase n=1 Tax=Flavobacterium sp. LHD-85 TaxID=3071410 RepID=UPI0027E0ED98|nr:alkyl sulfatase dimerization domain-containing protein [Flavobacterium sp. LHD-85]MDQ6532176.1 alkyl sulfatase dimerization domain-containing protein [Flavobacterium sp. LHD-85]
MSKIYQHKSMKIFYHVMLLTFSIHVFAQQATKSASSITEKANNAVLNQLPFNDKQDFEDAKKGFIAPLLNDGIVKNNEGAVIYNSKQFVFPIDQPAPPTVNPSLWRQSQLNGIHGLFKVSDGIYQVRGLDISNITFIETNKGVIIMDPLVSAENARDGLELYKQHRPGRPVVAVIYTHSHTDHCNGVRGVVDEKDVKSGKVKIIAPEGFTEELVSEDVYAGNAMLRRATYSYSALVKTGPMGNVGTGLGIGTSHGSVTLLLPTDLITKKGQKMNVDGLDIEFLLTPGTEAPAEMHFFIPKYKALCTAENACHTLHNFYTLRGAKTRNVSAWVKYLNETLDLWGGKAEVLFMPHTWPVWGNERIVDHIEKYRDAFRYIHDQALHLANEGYTIDEIGDMVQLPPQLSNVWSNRGYYGSVSHNARAVYNYYLGYFDGNPADLHRHTPVERAKRYVKAMGGADKILIEARNAFKDGDYQWTSEILKHVVYADPSNSEAKNLQADAFEQLGYQAEAATWRGFYLVGAAELRNGVTKQNVPNISSPDVINAMTPPMLFDYLAIRLNGDRASKTTITINLDFVDLKEKYGITIKNGVLNYRTSLVNNADVNVSLTKKQFNDLIDGSEKIDNLVSSKKVAVTGNKQKFNDMLSLIDNFNFWFNIVTPN